MLFVSLGLGSVIASMVEVAPWITAVGRYKAVIFPAVGVLLAFDYWMAIVRPRQLDCAPGEICHIDSPISKFNRVMFWTSVGIYVVAIIGTYGAEWWILRS